MADLMAAGVLCFTNDGNRNHYLVLRSAKHGEWGPPKGHADKGETDVETALRETFEEVGLERRFIEPIGAWDRYDTITGYRGWEQVLQMQRQAMAQAKQAAE